MITIVTLLLAAHAACDTTRLADSTRAALDSARLTAPGPVAAPTGFHAAASDRADDVAPADTITRGDRIAHGDTITRGDTIPRPARRPRPRVQAVEYSDWYGRRLAIHRWASYTMLPTFAFQYVAGKQLLAKSSDAPMWAKSGHRIAATATAGLFGLNTLTGVWNLWDGRHDASGRKWRMAHSILMLLADGGFTATGLLATPAQSSASIRRLHEQIAIASMATAGVAFVMMVPPFRR